MHTHGLHATPGVPSQDTAETYVGGDNILCARLDRGMGPFCSFLLSPLCIRGERDDMSIAPSQSPATNLTQLQPASSSSSSSIPPVPRRPPPVNKNSNTIPARTSTLVPPEFRIFNLEVPPTVRGVEEGKSNGRWEQGAAGRQTPAWRGPPRRSISATPPPLAVSPPPSSPPACVQQHHHTTTQQKQHLPGLHWYHPHQHGSTTLQVGTAHGAIVIDDDDAHWMPPGATNCSAFTAVTSQAVDRIFDVALFFFKKPNPDRVKVPDSFTVGNVTVSGFKAVYTYSRRIDDLNNGARGGLLVVCERVQWRTASHTQRHAHANAKHQHTLSTLSTLSHALHALHTTTTTTTTTAKQATTSTTRPRPTCPTSTAPGPTSRRAPRPGAAAATC